VSDTSGELTDLEARRRARQIVDRLLFDVADVAQRRTDADGLWATPPDMAGQGDGSGLLAVAEGQVFGPLERALGRARADAARLRVEMEDRKRRMLGENYRPPGEGTMQWGTDD
jgi:hypothetical protein